jgi:hypothetical protein
VRSICDLAHRLQTRHGMPDPTDDQVYDFGLYLIDQILHKNGHSLSDFQDIPQVTGHWDEVVGNRLVAEQRAYDPEMEMHQADETVAKLNEGQRLAHDQILEYAMA